jgi:hypothetical protein
MPEFYSETSSNYQKRAQPYLDAVARGIKTSETARTFLLKNTVFETSFAANVPLWAEQWQKRDRANTLGCPFWANHWYEVCASCDCREPGTRSMETDAIFALRNAEGRVLALHIEFKHAHEAFRPGQAESYKRRAACFRDRRKERKTLLDHHDYATVLLCGRMTAGDPRVSTHFDRVVSHDDAAPWFDGYPAPDRGVRVPVRREASA